MSTPPKGKLPLPELAQMKRRGEKIVMVTAYDAPGARFAEDAGIDVILVGDTAAMVAGADAVKLEGAGPSVSRVRSIVEAGIPVMGHVGLTPQSATMLGGFKTQGKTAEKARHLVDGALELEEAGAFAVVLEAVPAPVAAEITRRLTVPTIGIGAGRECDGQVLVYHDLLGLTEGHLPRFVKRYANLSREIRDALEHYAEEVRSVTFPEDEHTYEMADDELERFSSKSPSATSPKNQAKDAATRPSKILSPSPKSAPPLRKTSPP